MKSKLLILGICISSICNAQDTVKTSQGKYVKLNNDNTWEYVESLKILSRSEIKYNDKGLCIFNKIVKLKNGKNEMIDVPLAVTIVEKYGEAFNFENIDLIIEIALMEAKYSLKNKSTFSPINMKLTYYNDDGLIIWLDYTGQNDYGAIKDATKLIYFDKEGKKIKAL